MKKIERKTPGIGTAELSKDYRLLFKAVIVNYERCIPCKIIQVHLEEARVPLSKQRIHPFSPVTVTHTHTHTHTHTILLISCQENFF